MSRLARLQVPVAAALGGIALAYVLVAQSVLSWKPGDVLWNFFAIMPMYALGVFVATRRPDSSQTLRLLWLGVLLALGSGFETLAAHLYEHSGAGSGFWVLQLIYEQVGALQLALGVSLIGLYPDGVIERPWMRWPVRLIWLAPALPVLLMLTRPNLVIGPYFPVRLGDVPSPFYLPAVSWLGGPVLWLQSSYALVFIGPILLAARYRIASPPRRAMMRWLLYGALLGTVMLLGVAGINAIAPAPDWVTDLITGAVSVSVMLLFVVTLAVGILHHGLFEIDIVVRRSTTFALLWLAIAAVYIALAVAPGLALGGRIPVQVAVLVTILVAITFQPLRRRFEVIADRLVFGERLDRYELVHDFGAALAGSIDAATLLPRLAETVRAGLRASWVRVTLQDTGTAGIAGIPSGAADLTHDVRRDGELLGLIECGPREGSGASHTQDYDQRDRDLLATLTGQAATAIANTRLAAQLSQRVEELARSRTRIVMAADAERRRIERNIHDGAQQEVVALITKLRLARNRVDRGESPAALLGELQADSRELLTDLRELAQGIHPPVLSDNGLVAAVEARAGRLAVPVSIHVDGVLRTRRLDEDVEGAAYFVVCEALSNVVKHAGATSTQIRMDLTGDCLHIAIDDDGTGFGPSQRNGTGLTNIRDRVETLGGRFRIESALRGGTRVRAELPVAQ